MAKSSVYCKSKKEEFSSLRYVVVNYDISLIKLKKDFKIIFIKISLFNV